MDKPISAGDLVQIVRPMPCGCTDSLGWIYRVVEIAPQDENTKRCRFCSSQMNAIGPLAYREDGAGAEVYRLKRIDPLPEQETEKHDEEITA